MIYLDWNATAPLHPAARAAMEPWLGPPANPSSAHRFGQRAAMAVEVARAQVATACHWRSDGVVFTSGATEANATLLRSGRWLASAVDHPSVLAWAEATIPVDADGVIRLDALVAALAADRPTGVAVMLANNETGVVQPIRDVLALCRAAGVKLHVDASQAPGRIPLPWADGDRPDSVTVSSHKVGGPVGVGALLLTEALDPLLRGGGQERGRRGGTTNTLGIVGFGAAMAAATPPDVTLRDRLESGLVDLGGRVAGAGAPRLPNTSCVHFPGVDAGDLVAALDLEGIAVSAGSACASGSSRPSPVLSAMGFPGSAVRLSLGASTPPDAIDATLAATARVLARVRTLA